MEPQTQPQTNKFLVPLAIVVAGVLVAGAIYFGGAKSLTTDNRQPTADVKVAPVTAKDHILGSPSAEVVVIEYSDTECPFCKVFHNSMRQIMGEYSGRVAWVYRQLPIPQLHSKAPKEAEATECVAELAGNSAFWSYLDKIFETTKSNDSLDLALLPKLATQVGVSESAFSACLDSGKYTQFIKDSMTAGFNAGARGTPYSVIMVKGKQTDTINGAEPLAGIKAKIDALLK